MDQALVELNQKVDHLTAQIQLLTEQAAIVQRQREERAELMHDVLPIANDIYRLSVDQLEEIEQYVDLGDLLRVFKRVLRNGRNFEVMLDQLESMIDLLKTVGPLTDSAFTQAVDLLQEMEHRGYFAFARGGARIVDNLVTSFGEEEMRQLSDNIVPIVQTVKELTRPEVMQFVRGTAADFEQSADQPLETSLLGLARQMRDPDVRRGLSLTLRILRAVGAQSVGASAAGAGTRVG